MSRRRNHPLARQKRDGKLLRRRAEVQIEQLKRAAEMIPQGEYVRAMNIILPISREPLSPLATTLCKFYASIVAYKQNGRLRQMGHPGAEASAREMVRLMESAVRTGMQGLPPKYLAEAHYNLAAFYAETGEADKAASALEGALDLLPRFPQAWGNLGNARMEQGRVDEALACYEKAAATAAGEVQGEAAYNVAIAKLMLGQYAEGWRCYEERFKVPLMQVDYERPDLPMPYWAGEDLTGKTLLLHEEQGFGDMVQMVRFVPHLRKMHPATTLAWDVHPGLLDLYRASGVIRPGEWAHPKFQGPPRPGDYRLSLMSLPAVTGLVGLDDIPPATVFARPTPEVLPGAGTRRLGFYWRGASGHRNDGKRSTALALWEPLLRLPGITWVCLQADWTEEERAWLERFGVVGFRRPDTWSDTARVLVACERVVGVDSAIAHVAGALGVPVDLMLTAASDYRWLVRRPDSPWYPTHRLFRQDKLGEWGPVVARVAEALAPTLARAA